MAKEGASGIGRRLDRCSPVPEVGLEDARILLDLARPIVNDKGLATHLSVCGDDRVVFTTDREGAPHVWQVALDGSDLRQLVNLPRGESNTACSRDGRHVVFVAFEGRRLLRIGPNGPEPLDDGRYPAVWPAISPDNRWVAYNRLDPDGNSAHLVVIPIAGNAAPIQFEFGPGSQQPRQLAWRADSSAITYVRTVNGVGNLWMQPLAGGPPKKLTEFTSGLLFEHAWAADGRLAIARGSSATDVVLLSGR